MTRSFSKSVRMYFFSALASALSSLKQNLEKSYIPDLCKLHAWMKLHVWMKEYFSVIFYSFFFSFHHKLHQSTNTYNYHGNDHSEVAIQLQWKSQTTLQKWWLQRLIMAPLNETLQRRRFCNVFRRIYSNYMAMVDGKVATTL